jgi:hypothetical protein
MNREQVDGWQRNVLVRVSSNNLQIKADGYSDFALGQGDIASDLKSDIRFA